MPTACPYYDDFDFSFDKDSDCPFIQRVEGLEVGTGRDFRPLLVTRFVHGQRDHERMPLEKTSLPCFLGDCLPDDPMRGDVYIQSDIPRKEEASDGEAAV